MALPDVPTLCNLSIQLSADGSFAGPEMASVISSLDPIVQRRVTGEIAVMGQDAMIPTVGKREPVEIRFRGPYSEEAAIDVFSLLHTQWTTNCGGTLYIRWGYGGAYQWNSFGGSPQDFSRLTSLTWPGGDAADAGPIEFEAVIRASTIQAT